MQPRSMRFKQRVQARKRRPIKALLRRWQLLRAATMPLLRLLPQPRAGVLRLMLGHSHLMPAHQVQRHPMEAELLRAMLKPVSCSWECADGADGDDEDSVEAGGAAGVGAGVGGSSSRTGTTTIKIKKVIEGKRIPGICEPVEENCVNERREL